MGIILKKWQEHANDAWGIYVDDVDEVCTFTRGENSANDFISGFNSCKEMNKDKIFTIEDMEKAFKKGRMSIIENSKGLYGKEKIILNNFIASITPKTQWNITFENDKLVII